MSDPEESTQDILKRVNKSWQELKHPYAVHDERKVSWIMLSTDDFNKLIFEANHFGLAGKRVRALQYGDDHPRHGIVFGHLREDSKP